MKAQVTEVKHPTTGKVVYYAVSKNGRPVSHTTALSALQKMYPEVPADAWERKRGNRFHVSRYTRRESTP